MALIAAEVIVRRVAALVLLVDQHRVALRERAALGVLSGQPHVVTLLQQRAEGQGFAGRPVDPGAALDRFHAIIQETCDGPVNPEAVRHLGDLAADVLEHGNIDAGDAAARLLFLIGVIEARTVAVVLYGLVRLLTYLDL